MDPCGCAQIAAKHAGKLKEGKGGGRERERRVKRRARAGRGRGRKGQATVQACRYLPVDTSSGLRDHITGSQPLFTISVCPHKASHGKLTEVLASSALAMQVTLRQAPCRPSTSAPTQPAGYGRARVLPGQRRMVTSAQASAAPAQEQAPEMPLLHPLVLVASGVAAAAGALYLQREKAGTMHHACPNVMFRALMFRALLCCRRCRCCGTQSQYRSTTAP